MKRFLLSTLFLVLYSVISSSQATILFADLGTSGPPTAIGPYFMQPFDQTSQAAIPDFTIVNIIPGSPIPGNLSTTTNVMKVTIGNGWATWSHGYTGVVYSNQGVSTLTMNLPPNTRAFYFYVEPDSFDVFDISATTDVGSTSGAIPVEGNGGANGFAFFSSAGESITSITVTAEDDANGFAIGEFGIANITNPPQPQSPPSPNGLKYS